MTFSLFEKVEVVLTTCFHLEILTELKKIVVYLEKKPSLFTFPGLFNLLSGVLLQQLLNIFYQLTTTLTARSCEEVISMEKRNINNKNVLGEIEYLINPRIMQVIV